MKPEEAPLAPAFQTVLDAVRVKQIPGGQIIFYEDDLPQDVFIIKQGVVKLYDIDDQGNEKILHLVKSPAVIPFAFFSGMKTPLRWFYASLTDCELYVFSASELQGLTRANPAFVEALTQGFSSDVHELLVRLSSLGKTSARDKVLYALRFLMVCHALKRAGDWYRVEFPVNHQLIADVCGITRETAALVMKGLQREGIIRNPRSTILEINRAKLLAGMATP